MNPAKQSSQGDPSFLVFSDDWGEHPSSCQHIFRYIAEDHKVLWVNTIGMRTPKLDFTDFRKIFYKVRKMLLGTQETVNRSCGFPLLNVCQPPMLPYSNFSFIRALNKYLVLRTVEKKLAALNIGHPVLVTTVPNACDYVGAFRERKKIYYCVDDFTLWPGLDHENVRQMETELIEKCDTFIATSSNLYERLRKTGKSTTLITHGVDVEFFSNFPEEEHPLLSGIPNPRVGYFGLFDERSDQDILAGIVARLPEVSFIITGPVEVDISHLNTYPNVYFTGAIPYRELPEMVKGWDACMLPYKINSLTESINPLKLKEYIATGKPVLATPLTEVVKLCDLLLICETVDDFVYHLQRLDENSPGEEVGQRSEMLQQESWAKKSNLFLHICCDTQSSQSSG